jgi:hypothetical protein
MASQSNERVMQQMVETILVEHIAVTVVEQMLKIIKNEK